VALNFLLIAGCAYFGARAVNDTVARRLIVIPPAPNATLGRPGPIQHPRDVYNVIVDRDIFNAVKQEAAPPPPPSEPPPADLHLKLVGVSLPSWTRPFAILEDNNTHDQAVYQLGNQIPDAGELTAVSKTKVTINHNGTLVTLEMQTDQPDQSAGAPPAPSPIMAAMPPIPPMPEFNRDVRRVGPNEFAITRSAVDRNLQNMGQLFTQMRAIPNVQDGKTDGFRLSEVVPGSLFQQMGLRNGDVISSISGQDLNDPTQAIALLNSLRNSSALSITVRRHGRPVELNYQIQ
jgi:general secretion pathway protein C